MRKFPQFLYRGDNDLLGKKNLRPTLDYGQLQTTLLNGGQGHLVFTTPIQELISRHVQTGWDTSNFLSFSEDINTAYRYALDCASNNVEELLAYSMPHDRSERDWDYVIIKLDISRVKWRQISPGIYEGLYPTDKTKFAKTSTSYRAILIDILGAMNVLSTDPAHSTIKANASRDIEWLILPATAVSLNFGRIEYSGILDISYLLADIEKYIIDHLLWNKYKIHRLP